MFFAFSTILLAANLSLAPNFDNFLLPNAQTAIGDQGHYYLKKPGWIFGLNNNDMLTPTDKHMTGGFSLGRHFMHPYHKTTGIGIDWNWRLITPAFTRSYEIVEADDYVPIGRFADWMDLTFSVSNFSVLAGRWYLKTEASFGIGHVGNKGGRELQIGVHKLFAGEIDRLTYDNQPKGFWVQPSIKTGVIHPFLGYLWVRCSRDVVSSECGYGLNHTFTNKSGLDIGIEMSRTQLFGSEMYTLQGYRTEYGFSVSVSDVWTPGIKYVSDYIEGDDYEQVYVDLVKIQW